MRLLILLSLWITFCPTPKHLCPVVIVLAEDGCTQERDCTCGYCPEYGVDQADPWWAHLLWSMGISPWR